MAGQAPLINEVIDIAVLITILKILIAILVFGLIILVHELGHFLMCRLMGVKVNEFAIGMGPRLLKFGKKETVYSLRAFPIGGFCAMEGEDAAGGGEIAPPRESGSAADTALTDGEAAADAPEAGPSRDPRAFCNKKVWRRVLIVIAGAVMNLVLGFVLLVTYFAVFTQPEEGEKNARYTSTVVAAFHETATSNQDGGLLVGDKIVKIDGKMAISAWDLGILMSSVPVTKYTDADGGEAYKATMDITVQRTVDGRKQTVQLDNVAVPAKGEGQLIIDFYVKGIDKTILSTLAEAGKMECSVGILIWRSLGDMLTGKYGISQLSGPVGVVDAIGDAAVPSTPGGGFQIDWQTLLLMVVMITVNVGIFNLLPLPALDGGRLVFLAIEGIFRRPVPAKYEGWIHAIGLLLLIGLILFVTFFDIKRIFGA